MIEKYTVRTVSSKDLTPTVLRMMFDAGVTLSGKHHRKLFKGWKMLDYKRIADVVQGLVLICYRGDRPVGILIATRSNAFWNPENRILKQQILYAKPGTRASYHLMKHFIDIGRASADTVITMIGEHTNISERSLEKLGFKKLETLYTLEV